MKLYPTVLVPDLEDKLLIPVENVYLLTLDEVKKIAERGWDACNAHSVWSLSMPDKKDYLSKLWLLGIESTFESNGQIFNGSILGTDEYGRLLVEVNKEIKTFDLKEIKFSLRNEP